MANWHSWFESSLFAVIFDDRRWFECLHEEKRRGGSNKPLSTDTPSTHKGIPLGKVPDISVHIPPLLLSETWMIWLFDDSLFLKSVSAPYVSNMQSARHMNALPWGLWEASAVFKPGGRIACELRQAYRTVQKRSGLNSSACSRNNLTIAMHLVFSRSFFFYYELIILLKAISAVFKYLGLSQTNQTKQNKAMRRLSLFPLPSWGSILVIIIGSPVFFYLKEF